MAKKIQVALTLDNKEFNTGIKTSEKQVSNLKGGLGGLKTAVAGLFAVMGGRELANFSDGITTLQIGNYITLNYGHDKQYKNKKFKITYMNEANNTITLNDTIEHSLLDERPTWNLAKDDVSPQDIFRLQEGSDDDRKIVAVYCIQDCALCNYLIDKLKLITNNIGMANVCSVPLSYLFLRGQGVKIFSLVSHQCRKEGFLIPVVKHKKDEVDLNDLNSYKDNTNIKRNIFQFE